MEGCMPLASKSERLASMLLAWHRWRRFQVSDTCVCLHIEILMQGFAYINIARLLSWALRTLHLFGTAVHARSRTLFVPMLDPPKCSEELQSCIETASKLSTLSVSNLPKLHSSRCRQDTTIIK